jgi:hypothetical protein
MTIGLGPASAAVRCRRRFAEEKTLTSKALFSECMTVRDYEVSVTFDAPIDYVYKWCTDYREYDGELRHDAFKRNVVDRSNNRVVFIDHTNPGGPDDKEKVRIITLKRNAWSMSGFDEGANITGMYKLQSLGKNKTKLKLNYTLTFKTRRPVSKKEMAAMDTRDWNYFKAALESDYSRGKSPVE